MLFRIRSDQNRESNQVHPPRKQRGFSPSYAPKQVPTHLEIAPASSLLRGIPLCRMRLVSAQRIVSSHEIIVVAICVRNRIPETGTNTNTANSNSRNPALLVSLNAVSFALPKQLDNYFFSVPFSGRLRVSCSSGSLAPDHVTALEIDFRWLGCGRNMFSKQPLSTRCASDVGGTSRPVIQKAKPRLSGYLSLVLF